MLVDALGGHLRDRRAHQPGHIPPALIRHFVHVAVRAGQIAATVDLEDELLKRHRLVAGLTRVRDVKVLKRPRGEMPGHPNHPATSSGSCPAPRRQWRSNRTGRWAAKASWRADAGSRCSARASPTQASGCGSAEPEITSQ